ncbi:hypothetical protein FE257_005692 [Aspergillus nanangensis]|uniref:Uncharacterized protein n=1 Tax=Aspergillus nanangensis TaxID=2582783 RepID=A0AAD4GV99_ASPNN|nr:hypothetical protein FE257_005692 [Aspergillus nanangensis]
MAFFHGTLLITCFLLLWTITADAYQDWKDSPGSIQPRNQLVTLSLDADQDGCFPFNVDHASTGLEACIAIQSDQVVVNYPDISSISNSYKNVGVVVGKTAPTSSDINDYPFTLDKGYCTVTGSTTTCSVPISEITINPCSGTTWNMRIYGSLPSGSVGIADGQFNFGCGVHTTSATSTTTTTTATHKPPKPKPTTTKVKAKPTTTTTTTTTPMTPTPAIISVSTTTTTTTATTTTTTEPTTSTPTTTPAIISLTTTSTTPATNPTATSTTTTTESTTTRVAVPTTPSDTTLSDTPTGPPITPTTTLAILESIALTDVRYTRVTKTGTVRNEQSCSTVTSFIPIYTEPPVITTKTMCPRRLPPLLFAMSILAPL